jgi:hypothetical protein
MNDTINDNQSTEDGGAVGKPAVTRRVLLRVGMRVVVKASGLEATVHQVMPNRYVICKYDAPPVGPGGAVGTLAAGLLALDGSPVFHPNGG